MGIRSVDPALDAEAKVEAVLALLQICFEDLGLRRFFSGTGHVDVDEIGQVLAARGYEPYRDGARLRLRNCPFAHLAHEYPVLVCAMNLSLIEGLLEGIGEPAGRVTRTVALKCRAVK